MFKIIFNLYRNKLFLLKAQLEDLKDDLCKAKCQAQKADILAMEVSSLRNEVLKRDLALNDYDCQYKQLMVSTDK